MGAAKYRHLHGISSCFFPLFSALPLSLLSTVSLINRLSSLTVFSYRPSFLIDRLSHRPSLPSTVSLVNYLSRQPSLSSTISLVNRLSHLFTTRMRSQARLKTYRDRFTPGMPSVNSMLVRAHRSSRE